MASRTVSPNPENARALLSKLWKEVLDAEDGDLDPTIDALVNSKLVSIRYALPVQLLGKATEKVLDALCLQKGDSFDPSLWDPREFAKKVIVPWVTENDNVLGTSKDPYVGNPTRVPRIVDDRSDVRKSDAAEWKLVFRVLNTVQQRNDAIYTRETLIQVLKSVKARLRASQFEFVVPERISLKQTEKIISLFLDEASGGDRGLAVATALFQTIGGEFGLYNAVSRHAINASDASTGATADIECIGTDGKIALAIEVKERNLTLIDVKDGIRKARKEGVTEFLFNVPDVLEADKEAVEDLIEKTWGSGTNLYRLSIDDLVGVCLVIAGEIGRRRFLINLGEQLNLFNTQPSNRLRWKELLESV